MLWAPVYCPKLIGRQPELDLMAERLRDAAAGHGSLVLLAGEAGIGKSRLAAELCARAAVAGARSAVACCHEYAKEPLAPVRTLLGALGDGRLPPAASRLELFDALAERFSSIVRAKPAAVVIEDLQWADAATLAFLQHVARPLAEMRLVVVGTYRTDDAARRSLHAALARLERLPIVWRLTLGPLSDADIDELIERALERRHHMPADVRARIRRLAEGNPLFAEELMKSAMDRAPGEPLSLPRSISHAVHERLARLRSGERRLLECAAAIGRDFDEQLVALITGEPEERVGRAMQRAAEQQLLVAQPHAHAAWRFRHALVREVIYDDITATTRRSLHARIAVTLDNGSGAGASLAALAYHYAQAGMREKALSYNRLAGEAAAAMYAFDEAVACYERALQAVPEAPAIERGELYERLAQALYSVGLGERAQRAWLNAIAAYQTDGDAERLAQARIDYGRFCYNMGTTDEAFRQARLALQALERTPNSPLRFTAHVSLAGHYATLGDPSRTLEELDAAARLPVSRRPKDEALFHEYRGGAFAHLDDPVACSREFHAAIAIARRIGNIVGAARLLSNYGVRMAQFGEPQETRKAFDDALALFETHHITGAVRTTCLLQYAVACERLGELCEARRLLEQCRLRRVETTRFALYWAALAIDVGLALEDEDLVGAGATPSLLEEAFTSAATLASVLVTAFVRLYLHRGLRADAAALLRRGWTVARSHDPSLLQAEWLCVQVAALLEPAEIAEAERMLARRLALAPCRATRAHHVLVAAWRAKREHNAAVARERAEQAAALFEALHWPQRQAQALELAGRRRAALDVYRRFGYQADVRRIEAVLRPAKRDGCAGDILTRREREVAQLVAEGKSNRQIADVLVIGERTVESHIAAILQKLGLATRVEIAVHQLRGSSSAPGQRR